MYCFINVNSFLILFLFYANCYFFIILPRIVPINEKIKTNIIAHIPCFPNVIGTFKMRLSAIFNKMIMEKLISVIYMGFKFDVKINRAEIRIDNIAENKIDSKLS